MLSNDVDISAGAEDKLGALGGVSAAKDLRAESRSRNIGGLGVATADENRALRLVESRTLANDGLNWLHRLLDRLTDQKRGLRDNKRASLLDGWELIFEKLNFEFFKIK